MLQCTIKEKQMKIIKKIIKKAKNFSMCKKHDDTLKAFFKTEYKKNADAAFQYYKAMNDLNYHR